MDGSQKIPQRWLETLAARQASGKRCPVILQALAAWLCHLRGDNGPVDDPMAETFAQAWQPADAATLVDALFSPRGLYGGIWRGDDEDRRTLIDNVTSDRFSHV